MPLETFVAGQFTSKYNDLATGSTESGYILTQESRQENIERSDKYGDSMLDYVWRGGNIQCRYDVLQATVAATVAAYWPWSASRWTLSSAASPIGRLASDLAKVFVLNSTANTPAAALPASLTAAYAIVPPNYSFEDLYDSRLRKISIRLQFLPYSSGGSVIWAVQT